MLFPWKVGSLSQANPSQTPPLWVLSMGYGPSRKDCSGRSSPPAAVPAGKSAPLWGSSPLVTDSASSLFLYKLYVDCRGISVLRPEAPPPPLSSLTFCLQDHFSHIFFLTPLSTAAECFVPFIKYAFQGLQWAWLLGSAVSCSRSTGTG